jgi:hypothetical protein
MKNIIGLTILSGILALPSVLFIVVLLLTKLLWTWTIPDIFPGAVEQGLIAGSISWFSAFKIAIFASILAWLSGARGNR